MRLAVLVLLAALHPSDGDDSCEGMQAPATSELCLGKLGEEKEYKSLEKTVKILGGQTPKLMCSELAIDCDASNICKVMLDLRETAAGSQQDRFTVASCIGHQCPKQVFATADVLNGVPGAKCPEAGSDSAATTTVSTTTTISTTAMEAATEKEYKAVFTGSCVGGMWLTSSTQASTDACFASMKASPGATYFSYSSVDQQCGLYSGTCTSGDARTEFTTYKTKASESAEETDESGDEEEASGAKCVDTDDVKTDTSPDLSCHTYTNYPNLCGKFDDSDFKADELCCACGGGKKVKEAASIAEVTTSSTTLPTTLATTLPTTLATTLPATLQTTLPTTLTTTPEVAAAAPASKKTTTLAAYTTVEVKSLSTSLKGSATHVAKPGGSDRTMDIFIYALLGCLLIIMLLERMMKRLPARRGTGGRPGAME